MSLTVKVLPVPFWLLERSLGALEGVQPDEGWTPSLSSHNKHFQDPALHAGQYFHFKYFSFIFRLINLFLNKFYLFSS